MFTKPSQVLIGKTISAKDLSAAAVGDIIIVDETMTKAATANAKSLYIGVCTAVEDGVKIMKWSDRIQKESKPSFIASSFEAPVNAQIEFDFTDAEIVAGHRYVIRILYKDLNIANFQFTHTYEHVATDATVASLIDAFVAKINKHANRRVNVAKSGSKLTLTAKDKNYDNQIDSLDEYSIVSMDASVYVTIPGALLSNQPEKVIGVEINKIEGKAGKGFWKQVRDAEVRAMGYRGIVKTGAYPSIEQERMVTKGANYNCLTIENDNLYLSPDNQYIKTTPVLTEIYCEGATTAAVSLLTSFGAVNKTGVQVPA